MNRDILIAAIEASSDGILVSDKDGVVIYVNKAYENTTGVTGKSALTTASPIVVTIAAFAGKKLFNYFPPIIIEALGFVLPSIFGGLFALFAVKYPKYATYAITIALVLNGIVKVIPTFLLVPMCVFSTMGFAFISYKRKVSNK